MRRFLTALATFSVLVMAQNVLAITPASEASTIAGLTTVSSTSHGSSNQADPVSLALLLVGLAGLTAAGDARSARPSTTRA